MEPQRAPSPSARLESYLAPMESVLGKVIQSGSFELTFAIRKNQAGASDLEAPEFVVDFSGPDKDLLLEKNAELLNALEYVVLKAVRLEESLFAKITFDCGDWRRLRSEELKLTAQVAAERVAETGQPFTFSPLSPRERRIIHMALKSHPHVQTISEGVGSDRRVVVLPASPSPRKR